MLQTQAMFRSGNPKSMADAKQSISASFTLPVENPGRLNEMVEKALQAGGTEPRPIINEGFMQVRTIEDLDGHTWGIMYLDLEKFKEMKGR